LNPASSIYINGAIKAPPAGLSACKKLTTYT